MPTVKNNGSVVKFLGNIPVYPTEEKIVFHYPEVEDTDIEIISNKPTWPMGMTGPEKRGAITSKAIYQIPKGTNNLSIINISAGNVVVYAQERGDTTAPDYEDMGVTVGSSSVKVIPDMKNRFTQIEIYGTTAEGEVTVTFLE